MHLSERSNCIPDTEDTMTRFLPLASRITRARRAWSVVLILAAAFLLLPAVLAQDEGPPRIIGGDVAGPGEWPWQIAIVTKGSNPYSGQFCGGSLIDEEWVLTAAHCVTGETPNTIQVLAGIHNLSSPEAGFQRINVSAIYTHPGYFQGAAYNNDAALLRLSTAAVLGPTAGGEMVATIPLVPANVGSLAGEQASITGWGSTGSSYPSRLMEAVVPVVTNVDCNDANSYNGAITANMLCAGYAAGGVDACQGDSGGPLVVGGPSWMLAGITSWGSGCALPNKYGVYTRVSAVLGWIEDTMEPVTPPTEADIYVTTTAKGTTANGVTFDKRDIMHWDADTGSWSRYLDGSEIGLPGKADIVAFDIPNPANGSVVLAFAQNVKVTGLGTIAPHDLLLYDPNGFTQRFDGSDVGLSAGGEKIDAVEVLPGNLSPIGSNCEQYILISTKTGGTVTDYNGGNLKFSGEDVLGFCATQLGANTQGLWHLPVDGSVQGMPKNSTVGLSASADGQTLYLTTKGKFNVDSASGSHSMVYVYNRTTENFSGPIWVAAAEGMPKTLDGLDVIAP